MFDEQLEPKAVVPILIADDDKERIACGGPLHPAVKVYASGVLLQEGSDPKDCDYVITRFTSDGLPVIKLVSPFALEQPSLIVDDGGTVTYYAND